MKKKIALIAGGDSSEWKIALEGAALIEQVLDTDKYDVYKIVLHDGRWTYTAPDGATTELDRNDFTLTLGGRRIRLEYALILIHGTPGEDGRLQGYLDMMRIPYSSCGFVTSVITFDKAACKRALHGAGLNMAREILLDRHSQVDPDEVIGRLGLPLFVKPNASGSSFGVTKVETREQLFPAVEAAFAESDHVLMEECIDGREISCGVMIAGGKEYLFPITELVCQSEFFDYKAKYQGFSKEITPADLGRTNGKKSKRDDAGGLQEAELPGRGPHRFHRARRRAVFHRSEHDSGHERAQHHPAAGRRDGHEHVRTVRPDYRGNLAGAAMMIQIDDKIVSSELLTERFCCDLSHCKGICCVEGNAGAPLEIDEVEVLEHEWEAYRPYMKPEGIEAVERQGLHGSRRGRRPYHTADRRSRVRILVRGERRHDVRDRAGMEGRAHAFPEADFVPPVSDPAHYSEQRNRRPQLPPMGRLPTARDDWDANSAHRSTARCASRSSVASANRSSQRSKKRNAT